MVFIGLGQNATQALYFALSATGHYGDNLWRFNTKERPGAGHIDKLGCFVALG